MLSLQPSVDLGTVAMKEYSTFPKAPALLEPHHQIFSVISRTLVGGVTPICRDTFGVYNSPNLLCQQDTCWRSLTPLQRYSRCTLQLPSTRPTGYLLRESYLSVEMQSVYTTAPGHSLKRCNLRNSLLRCGTRPNEWGTQWDSNSLL